MFTQHRNGAAATLEQRQKEIAALLAPLNTSLEEYRKGLGEIEKARRWPMAGCQKR